MRLSACVLAFALAPVVATSSCHPTTATETSPPAKLAPLPEPTARFAEVVEDLRAVDAASADDGSFVRGSFRYYTRHDDNAQRVWCRARVDVDGGVGGAEQVLVTEREVHGSIGAVEVSPNGKWIAYTSRPVSVDRYAVHIKDAATGESVAPVVGGADFSIAWGEDDTLFYSRLDRTNRSTSVYALHPRSRKLPKLVHEEKDRTAEVMVAPAQQGPALFVRSPSSILAYRLDPLHDEEPTRGDLLDDPVPPPATTPSTTTAPSQKTASAAASSIVDGGVVVDGGGGSLHAGAGADDDVASRHPAVR